MRVFATQAALLTVVAAVVFVLLLFAPGLQAPFLVPKFAALEISGAMGFVVFGMRSLAGGGPRWPRPVTLGAGLVLLTSVVSWAIASRQPWGAPYAVDSLARLFSFAGVALAATTLPTTERGRAVQALTAAATGVALLGLLQHVDRLPVAIPVISLPGSTFGNRNAAGDVMALAFPFAAAAALEARPPGARGAFAAAALIELAFLAVTRTRGAWLAAGIAGVAVLLWSRPRRSRGLWAGGIIAVAVACLGAAWPARWNPHDAGDAKRYASLRDVVEQGFDARSPALRTRLGMWRRTLAMTLDHPLAGVGPGSWPVVFPLYAEPGGAADGVLTVNLAPREAHDDVLERAAETGIPGLAASAVLAAGVVAVARRRKATLERASAAGAVGCLAAFVALALPSFPMETPGTLVLGAVAFGIVVGAPGDAREAPELGRAAAFLLMGLLFAGLATQRAQRNVRASAWLGQAERALRRDHGPAATSEAQDALSHSLAIAPVQYRALVRRAQMCRREHLAEAALDAARRATAIEPFGPNALAVLSAAELDLGQLDLARADATRTLALVPDYPFVLDVRAQAAHRLGDEAAADADRARIARLAEGSPDDEIVRSARGFLPPP